ncbi:MAG: YdcF family protein [Deltaproteobacteria bacterium]|nr:YdcF family protein [Deltaproteobacteria bacterium]
MFILILVLAAGAAIPHLLAMRLPVPSGPPADAILVLTGGENRILEGFRAWKEGKGKELYILGAGGGARIERVLPGHSALSAEELRRVHIEGWSENTLENAFSAKTVVKNRGFERIVLITADYHMPRACLALRTVLPPGVSIAVITVRSDWNDRNALPRTLRLFFVEGWKYWTYRLFLIWE